MGFLELGIRKSGNRLLLLSVIILLAWTIGKCSRKAQVVIWEVSQQVGDALSYLDSWEQEAN